MKAEHMDIYCSCMEEIKRRTDAVHAILSAKHTTAYPATNIEFICLQIRKILELIALSSLVASKDEYARQHQKFAEHWRAKAILDSIGKLNPGFFPVPAKQVIDQSTGEVTEVVPLKDGFLTRQEFPVVYDECSRAIHATNPFGTPISYASLERSIPVWLGKIKQLLNHHLIQLIDESQMLWVLMQANTDGKVHAYLFEKIKGAT